jgi:hypothetical protein
MSVSRRTFCISLASLSAVVASSARASSPMHAITQTHQITPRILSDDIRSLETYIEQHPDTFSWVAHNELRHLYSPISERHAMHHVDIILAHSVMDSYILDILSGWELDHNPDMAIANLLDKVERHPGLLHLCAACSIKIGDVRAAQGDQSEAEQLYQTVIALGNEHGNRAPALKRYGIVANYRRRRAGA